MTIPQVVKHTFGIALVVFLALGLSQAQEAKVLPKQPGDVIRFEIKFDGPNAARIKTVDAALRTNLVAPRDQTGFTTSFGTDRGYLPSAPTEGSASYSDRNEFTIPPLHVENPKKFTPPSITVQER